MTPKIYMTRLSGYAALSMSATEDPLFPLENLQSYDPTDIWKSSATTGGQYIQIDFGKDVVKNFLLLDGHNLNTVDGYKLESCASPTFSSGVSEVIAANTPADNATLIREFPADSNRYMRLTFKGSNPLAALPYIGNLFIGIVFQFQYPSEGGFIDGDRQFQTNKIPSLSGLMRSSQAIGGRRRFEYQWKLIDDAEKADLRLVINYLRAGLIPFYFQYDSFMPTRLVLMDKDYMPSKHRLTNWSDTDTLVFIEYLPNDDGDYEYGGQTLVFDVPLVGA